MKLILLLLLILPVITSAQLLKLERDFLKPQIGNDEIISPRVVPESIFTVIAPSNIRRGKSYKVYAKGFGLKELVKLTILIKGTSDLGEPLIIKKDVSLSGENPTTSIEIDTSKINKGSYKLYVEGSNFLEERSLLYLDKKHTFMVHFNKAIFHPGDLLQFRIFSIDSETKSLNPVGPNKITISDQRQNEIRLFSNVTFINGKYENELQLGSKASVGIWKLEFRHENEYVLKQFEINEYQLPIVIAKLSVEAKVPFSFGKISITIDASYTFGGDASGNAEISIMTFGLKIFSRNIAVADGSATFDVDIVNDLKITVEQDTQLDINLVFIDQLTGNKISNSKSCQVVPKINEIFTKSNLMSKDGPFRFTIIIKKYDGSPLPEGFEVKVKSIEPSTIPELTLILDDNGMVSSSIDLPPNTRHVFMKVTANDANEVVMTADYVESIITGSSIEIAVLTESPKINEPVEIKFTVGEPIDYIMVHITSKGLLLESVKLDLTDIPNDGSDSRSTTYTFEPTFAHAPYANIIAYYINENGDFVTQQYVLTLSNDLPNYLKITTYQDVVEPRAQLSIQIESKIDSTVSLVAMDQRLLLLKSGSNFTKTEVFKELNKYNSNNNVRYDWKDVANYEYSFGGQGLYVFTNIPRPVRNLREMAYSIQNEMMDRLGGDVVKAREEVKIREDFRETFLWRDVDIKNSNNDNQGLETISEKVPESITTYLIYGVSMSDSDGMGLCDDNPFVTVFLPFFLSVELPYSVKRNEVLVQDIFLFNFLKKTQTVEVKITKDSEYEAVDLAKYGWTDFKGFYVKTIKVVIGKNNKLKFALRPKVHGFIPFQVTAKGPVAGDGLKKQLRVIPEGILRSITKSVFIAVDKSSSHMAEALLQCNLPDSAYQDTTEISATIVGDTFGKALCNLGNLIRMPGGCGEQTMLGLAPDIAIYGYLKAANKMTPALKSKLETYILSGYQNELRYLRNDGSFSAFGNNDRSGSTWLTAYVGLFFYFAKDFMHIDSNVINRTAEYVIMQQNADGSFKEPGRVIHYDMQGGSGKGIALTAYCTIFITNILPDYPTHKSARDNAIKYLEDHLSTVTSTYELGIISYALQLAASSKASDAYNLFNTKKTVTDTYVYWTISTAINNNIPSSLTIEITSYGLLTNIERKNNAVEVIKIVKYLISKSNNQGGYFSSQDTVMALYALSPFAKTFSSNSKVNIELSPNVGTAISAKVDSTNTLAVQSFELNPLTRSMKVSATTDDSGLAIVSLICNFYEDPTKVVPAFEVTSKYTYTCSCRITYEICARYIPTGTSNMAIMTVSLHSGYVTNENANNPNVSLTEVTNQGSTITFYFNTISNSNSCATLIAYRAKNVTDLKAGNIIVTDYYNTALEGTAALPVPDLK